MKNSILVCKFATVCIAVAFRLASADAAPPAVVKATGTIEPGATFDVNPQVAGMLTKIVNSSSGQRVKKGDVLAEIDSRMYGNAAEQAQAAVRAAQAGVEVAKAEVALAEAELQRCSKRAADKTGDPLDVDVAKAALDVAKAKVQTAAGAVEEERLKYVAAKINLDACQICSPIDGLMIDSRGNIGQYVAPAANVPSLLVVADNSKLQIWVSVAEDKIAYIHSEQTVKFTIDALPDKTFTGHIVQIRLDAASRENTVYYTVVVTPDKIDAQMQPYMTANVEIPTGEHP